MIRTKTLHRPLDEVQAKRILGLNLFHVVEGGLTFRSVQYHEVRDKQLTMSIIYGETIMRILSRSGFFLSRSAIRCAAGKVANLAGCWLAHFHCWSSDGVIKPYDVSMGLARTKSNLEFLTRRGLPERIGLRLATALERTFSEEVTNTLATIHGDFKPSNLMVEGTHIIGVDMESYSRGHPLVDMGQFIASVLLLRSGSLLGKGSMTWWHHLCDHFLCGYASVSDLNMGGLEFRILDAILNVLSDLARRHGRVFWWFRGRPLMIRTIVHLLDNPISGGMHT